MLEIIDNQLQFCSSCFLETTGSSVVSTKNCPKILKLSKKIFCQKSSMQLMCDQFKEGSQEFRSFFQKTFKASLLDILVAI